MRDLVEFCGGLFAIWIGFAVVRSEPPTAWAAIAARAWEALANLELRLGGSLARSWKDVGGRPPGLGELRVGLGWSSGSRYLVTGRWIRY